MLIQPYAKKRFLIMVKSKFPVIPVTALIIAGGVVMYFNYRAHMTPEELMAEQKQAQQNTSRKEESGAQISSALSNSIKTEQGGPVEAKNEKKATLLSAGIIEPINPMAAYKPKPTDNMTQSNWYAKNALKNYGVTNQSSKAANPPTLQKSGVAKS